jgi:hypothetical protein
LVQVCIPAAVLLVALPIVYSLDLELVRDWAPPDVADALRVLWQVDAGALAIAFPLLVVFLQIAPGPPIMARRATEVLLFATETYRTGVALLVSVVLIGIGAIWFPSDEAAVLLFAAFVAAVGMLGWSFTKALVLLIDAEKLKALSNELLRSRLEASMTRAWVYARADEILTATLAHRNISLSFWRTTLNQPSTDVG